MPTDELHAFGSLTRPGELPRLAAADWLSDRGREPEAAILRGPAVGPVVIGGRVFVLAPDRCEVSGASPSGRRHHIHEPYRAPELLIRHVVTLPHEGIEAVRRGDSLGPLSVRLDDGDRLYDFPGGDVLDSQLDLSDMTHPDPIRAVVRHVLTIRLR